jgi:hypothetical protein
VVASGAPLRSPVRRAGEAGGNTRGGVEPIGGAPETARAGKNTHAGGAERRSPPHTSLTMATIIPISTKKTIATCIQIQVGFMARQA